MDRVRVRWGKTPGRMGPATAVGLLVALVLAAVLALGPTPAEAKGGGKGVCSGSVAGLPLESFGWSGESSVQCKYRKAGGRTGGRMIFVSSRWLSPAANCRDDSYRACPCSGNGCECFPWPGESTVTAKATLINLDSKAKAKKARRAALALAEQLRPRAPVCPTALATAEPEAAPSSAPGSRSAARTTTIELTGDRIARLEDGGGIGAIIELTPEERDALVASVGGEPITDEHLGRRGRVVEIGTVATSADGSKVISVTVELLDAEPSPSPSASPSPLPEQSTDERAAELADALLTDLETQFEAADAADRGTIGISADLVARIAGLKAVADNVTAVRLEDQRVAIETKEFGRVYVVPFVKDGKAGIDLWLSQGEIAGIELKIPVPLGILSFYDEGLPTQIGRIMGAVNGEASARDLTFTDVEITPEGVSIVTEASQS